ncbi:DNA binding [Phytophthora ramorum]
MPEMLGTLACTGTAVLFVPGGCTGVAQPLDVGVMSPLKQHMRNRNANRQAGRPQKHTPTERRRRMYERAMEAMNLISGMTMRNAFHKAGPDYSKFGNTHF